MRAVCWSGDVLIWYTARRAYETATQQASEEVLLVAADKTLRGSAADQGHRKRGKSTVIRNGSLEIEKYKLRQDCFLLQFPK